MYKLVLVCCTSLLVLSTTVRSDCDLRIRHPSPLFVTHFGFRKIVFEAQNDALTLGDGEWIAAYCNTKINIEYHDISAKILNMTCVSSRMHYEDSEGQLREFSNWIYCTGASHLQMYESSQPLPKCESFSTYGIGSHIESVEQYISTAICYDLDTLSLKYAHYIAYKPGYDTIVLQEPTKHALRGNKLDIDLSKQLDDFKHYFSFMRSDYGNLGFGKSVDLLCTSYDLQFKSVKSRQYQRLGNSNIYCGGPSRLNIYESSKSLPKCEPYSTYGIGNQIEGMADFISTAICYDLDTLSLKYAHYIAYKPSYYAVVSDESTDNTFRNNSLNIDLSKKLDDFNNYFTFMSTEAFTNALNLKKSTESLLQPFDFDYVSLLQDTPLATDVKDFGYLFNTMWLRQLRLGNWRLYLNALAERARSVQYAVYTGTHELLFMPPSSADCKTNISLTVMFEKSRVDAPAYMWSYVKSLHPDVAEEFVVIAHNSPYVKSPSSESFCEDMCDEIDWLKNSDFGKMRRNPMFGYAFCCRPEEVAEIIEHFPALEFKKLMPEPESEESTINPK